MDTKALRQKILDLAIQGKLVPQDPNDEPAAELLKRIGAKEVMEESEYPFEVPKSWEWTKLKNISSSIFYGVSKSAKKAGKYRLLRITDIQNDKVDWSSVPFTDYNEQEVDKYLLKEGDILFARTGATVGKSYLVKENISNAIYASYLIRVQLLEGILPEYIKAFFGSFFYWQRIKTDSVGTGQPNVNGTILSRFPIPIPPLPEQHRIVFKVNQLFSVIDSIEQSQSELSETVSQAKAKILDLAISGKLIKKTTEWKRCNLGDILYPMKAKKPHGNTFKYIDIKSIDNKRNVVSDIKVLPVSKAPSRASRFTEKGDTLFSMVRPYLRNIAIVEDDDCIASTGFFVCRPKEIIDSKYCFYFMLSPYTVDGLNSFLKGDNSPSINKWQVENWNIDLPSLSEQHDIVTKVDLLFSVLDRIKGNIQ